MSKLDRKRYKQHKKANKQREVEQRQELNEIVSFANAISTVVRDKERVAIERVLREVLKYGDKRVKGFFDELESRRESLVQEEMDLEEVMHVLRGSSNVANESA